LKVRPANQQDPILPSRGSVAARPRRIRGFSYRGKHRYLVTLCTRYRELRFVDGHLVSVVLSQLQRTASEKRFTILAHAFMPDHVHILVEGLEEDSDLRSFVKLAKQRAEYAARTLGVYPLWQEGYWDVVLKSWNPIDDALRYVVENPVTAGMSPRWRRHPYVSPSPHSA
jgi:putative transposase